MSKKDYIAIAGILSARLYDAKGVFDRTGRDEAIKTVQAIAKDLADLCGKNNPSFNRERFLKAAGM